MGRRRHQLPVLVDLPGHALAARPEDAVRDVADGAPHPQRGPVVGGDQSGSHARGSEDAREDAVVPEPVAGRVLGADHARSLRSGVVRDDLRVCRIPEAGRRVVGRLGRRLRAGVARQRRVVDEGHAARLAGVRAHQHHRPVAARRGRRPTSPRRATSCRTTSRISTRRRTTERRGRRSWTAFPPPTSRASSARTRAARACSTPAPRPASTSRSTMAATGSRCGSTCRSCQSTTCWSRTAISSRPRTAGRSGCSTTSRCCTR